MTAPCHVCKNGLWILVYALCEGIIHYPLYHFLCTRLLMHIFAQENQTPAYLLLSFTQAHCSVEYPGDANCPSRLMSIFSGSVAQSSACSLLTLCQTTGRK